MSPVDQRPPEPSRREHAVIAFGSALALVGLATLIATTRPYPPGRPSPILALAEVAKEVRRALRDSPRRADGSPAWPDTWGEGGLPARPSSPRLDPIPELEKAKEERTRDKDFVWYEVKLHGEKRILRLSVDRLPADSAPTRPSSS